jgi:hypothetical protein
VLVLVSLGIVQGLLGCTSTVRPPDSPLADPVTVCLVHDERHRGLVVPWPDGGFVEYGYGEWRWYAELDDAWYRAFPAVLWPTRGALGRRPSDAPDLDALRLRWSWLQLLPVTVERHRVDALRTRLEAAFAERAAELYHNAAYGFDFVPSEDGFWCLFNCNDAVAEWLEELGCTVSWVPIRTGLEVAGRSDG